MQGVRLFVAGRWRDGAAIQPLFNKFSGEQLAEVHTPSREQVGEATAALARAQATTSFTPYDRYVVLARASELLAERSAVFVTAMVAEAGFTVAEAAGEVTRGVQTLLLSGEEAKRLRGEMVPIEGSPGVVGRWAFTVRHPVGVVCAIAPFNSPLNTTLHKVAPALAAGNGVILKPSSYTPLTASLLVGLLLDAGLPPGLIALVNGSGREVGTWLLEDPVPSFYAFTGSTETGLVLQRAVGLRRVQLELGSLASTIICEDADVSAAAERCVNAAFRKAGQVCTSVQRLYVHERVMDDVSSLLARLLDGKRAGDPQAAETYIGPLISTSDAARVHSWIAAAAEEGAEVLLGGERRGALVDPTVLVRTTPSMKVMSAEIFGPVVNLRPFTDLDTVLDEVNDTPYGLAAGIFTASIKNGVCAANRLRVGSVHINETSNGRVDLAPYAGVKQSGIGREGPRYAIEEMTEERLVTLRW